MADVKEIYISDFFLSVRFKSLSGSEQAEVQRIQEQIDGFEYEADIYQWLYDQRQDPYVRARHEKLFGIPRNAVVTLSLHENKKNVYQNDKGPPVDHSYKKDADGNIKRDAFGNAKRKSALSRGLGKISEKAQGNIQKMAEFVIKYAKTILVLTSIFTIALVLVNFVAFCVGFGRSIGQSPFVLCEDNEQHGGGYTLDSEEQILVDEMASQEYMAAVFIKLADEKGFTTNATIGALSYILQEGSGMGTFTYEMYYLQSFTGPSGEFKDKTLSNAAWADWLEDSGKYMAHDLYYGPNGSSHYAAIGLGVLQESNVWDVKYEDQDGDGVDEEIIYLVTDNATRMMEFAEQRGRPWQDPMTQMEWVMQRLEPNEAWDGTSREIIDPTSDNRTAEEWCRRVCAGIGMPGWRWTKNNSYMDDHVAHIAEARAYYNQYSNKPLDIQELHGQVKDFCSGSKTVITGGNASIAEAAVSLAGTDVTKIPFDQHGINSPNLQKLPLYKTIKSNIFPNDQYYASCDRSAATAIRWSGADVTFPAGATGTQASYLKTSPKWTYIGIYGQCTLFPGDVLMAAPSGSKRGHIKIYVGLEAVRVKYPDSDSDMYAGSYESYFPRVYKDDPSFDSRSYEVYRCTLPDNDDRYNGAATATP